VVVAGKGGEAVILELNCETDFVARNPEFSELAEALATQALDSGAADAEALRTQPMAADPGITVEQAISQRIATIGENIVLSRLARCEAGPDRHLASYIHMGGSIGVVVSGPASVPEAALHDVALHVAAADPRYVNRDEVTQEILDTEREIALKQVMEQGKPEHIAERIVHGKMEKFFEQVVLLEQPFAKDPSKTVGQYLGEAGGEGATVNSFVRFKLGEASSE
jgi:elongation factor Ts